MKKLFLITVIAFSAPIFSMNRDVVRVDLAASFLQRAHEEVPEAILHITSSCFDFVYNKAGSLLGEIPWKNLMLVGVYASGIAVYSHLTQPVQEQDEREE